MYPIGLLPPLMKALPPLLRITCLGALRVAHIVILTPDNAKSAKLANASPCSCFLFISSSLLLAFGLIGLNDLGAFLPRMEIPLPYPSASGSYSRAYMSRMVCQHGQRIGLLVPIEMPVIMLRLSSYYTANARKVIAEAMPMPMAMPSIVPVVQPARKTTTAKVASR